MDIEKHFSKSRRFSSFKILLLTVFSLVFASSCKKDDDENSNSDNSTNGQTTAEFNSNVTYGTMTDQDGNTYKTVTIGTQTWMAENLRTTKYNDGSSISNITDNDEWANTTNGAYCCYNNSTSLDTIATYGYLYNWLAVSTGTLAPEGWHVATQEDWTTLSDYLLGEDVAGGKLKEAGTTHWTSPNTGASNATGFTALPGGIRLFDYGTFDNIGDGGVWWTSTEGGSTYAYYCNISYSKSYLWCTGHNKLYGYSVRCIKDSE